MGRIRLTGATSGYTELRAASTAGNNTITLPTTNGGEVIVSDSSGNVNIDSGTLYIDAANNRVGVGTTNFGGKLTVKTSSSNGAPIAWGDGQFVVTAGDGTTAPGFGISTNTSDNSISLSALTPGTGWNTIHYRAASHIFYKSDASSNEVGRWDSSGRLLVGTSTSRPTVNSGNSQVQIHDQGSARNLDLVGTANSPFGPEMLFIKARSGTNIVQNGDVLGEIKFIGYDGTADRFAGKIALEVDGTPGTNDMPGRLVFSTTADGASSPTERMRITQAGNTLIGSGSQISSERLGVTFAAGNQGIALNVASGAAQTQILFANPNGTVGTISTSGSATAYNTSSDYRLKENVTAVTDGITRLQQLKPSRFNFIADPAKTVDGFIAHEVQDVVPEAITGEKDAVDDDGNPIYQGIDQSKLVPLLTAALQEAVAKIKSLEARLTAAGI